MRDAIQREIESRMSKVSGDRQPLWESGSYHALKSLWEWLLAQPQNQHAGKTDLADVTVDALEQVTKRLEAAEALNAVLANRLKSIRETLTTIESSDLVNLEGRELACLALAEDDAAIAGDL